MKLNLIFYHKFTNNLSLFLNNILLLIYWAIWGFGKMCEKMFGKIWWENKLRIIAGKCVGKCSGKCLRKYLEKCLGKQS